MNQLSKYIALFIGFLFIIFPFLYEYFDNQEFCVIFAYTIIGSILNVFFLFKKEDIFIFLSPIDITIAIIGLYACILLYNQEIVDSISLYIYFLLLIFYLLSKIILVGQRETTIILYAIIISGIVQSILGILQFCNICFSNHGYFKLTGSFNNPGPLGGYISIGLITALGILIIGEKNKKENYFLYPSIVLLSIVCFLSDSRAAFFSVVFVVVVICILKIRWIKSKFMGCLLLLSLSVCLLVSLYYYRPHSADSRLFIWKICGNMIKEKPIYGHGISSFPAEYMLYQARYFEKNPEAKEITIASNNTLAFNECILLLCEQGIVGFFIYIVLLISILTILPFLKREKQTIVFILLSYLAFSMFSYPSTILPLLLFLPLCLGILSSTQTRYSFKAKLSDKLRFSVAIPFVLIIVYISFVWFSYFKIENTLTSYFMNDEVGEAKILKNKFPQFKDNRDQVLKYARVLFLKREYKDVIPVLTQAVKLVPSSEMYCDLGKSHQALDEYEDAENCYIIASKMLPAYIMPRYNLFLLYSEMGQLESANKIAKEIIMMKVKIPSHFTEQIKKEVRNYLEEQK